MDGPLMIPVVASASIGAEGADGGAAVSLFRHFVIEGGWITWFLLIPLSLVAVALIVHYLIVIRRGTLAPHRLAQTLRTACGQGQRRAALQTVRDDDTMLGRAACAGLSQLPAGGDAARAAIDETVEESAMRLLRRIEYLNIIGNVSPMIGLFGTVVGMIQAFARIYAAGGGMPEADKLAGDIEVALVTTFWGLLIAIPSLTAFALLRNRIDACAAEVVKLCDSLLAADRTGQPGPDRAPAGPG